MKTKSTYRLDISASTKNLSDVRNFIQEHSRDYGFSPESVHDICLAVDEAVTNIIKHAYNHDDSKQIHIQLEFVDEGICIILEDEGKSFKLEPLKRPDIKKKIERKKRGGMGVYLIHSLMDDVTYTSSGGQNKMEMCKYHN